MGNDIASNLGGWVNQVRAEPGEHEKAVEAPMKHMTCVACLTDGTRDDSWTHNDDGRRRTTQQKKYPGCWLTFENNEAAQAKEVAYSHNMSAILLKERVYA